MIFVIIVGALAFLDLSIKEEIEGKDDSSFPVKLDERGWITLHRHHNPGFSFGFLKRYPEVVRMLPVAVISAIGGVLCWLLPRKGFLAEKTALSVTLGGALSNLYDRLARRYVVDYFSIEWRWLKRVIFNLGDMFIFMGAILMLANEVIGSLRRGKS